MAVDNDRSTARKLGAFFGGRKKFWLLPIVLAVLLFCALLLLSSGSALAPFLYDIF
jgi:hypothetical protein